MNKRIGYESPLLLDSVPRRDLRNDPRFDVVETFEVIHAPSAFPSKPKAISSAHGLIKHVMLWYPFDTSDVKPYRDIYVDLMRTLPADTRITMAVHPGAIEDAEAIAKDRTGPVEIVETPDWLAFSVWAEDACVVVSDVSEDPPTTYLVEPYHFPRYGDQLIADFVAQATALQSTQLPLMFQGGNILIGDTFVLIGRDYLDESIDIALHEGHIDNFPSEGSRDEQETFIKDLFRKTFDAEREFYFLGSDPTGRPRNRFIEIEGETWLDEIDGGWGRRQPIFHIDMFVSLAGRDPETDRYRILVGDPRLGNEMLGWETSPHDLADEFDDIAAQLEKLDFDVTRTPIVHTFGFDRAPDEVELPDGSTKSFVGSRRWYHATANNCLVQIDGGTKEVWLPTYGHGQFEKLAPVDAEIKKIWEGIGFTVHQLSDFHAFAINQGALHCIKKYIAR